MFADGRWWGGGSNLLADQYPENVKMVVLGCQVEGGPVQLVPLVYDLRKIIMRY
jgi:hypothetical protein